MAALLRCHIFLEHELIQLVTLNLARPDAIPLQRLGFARLLSLAEALGCVPPDVQRALATVNGLRNRLAHRSDFGIGQAEEDELVACLSEQLLHIALGDAPDDPPFPDRLRSVLSMLWLVLKQGQDLAREAHRKRVTTDRAMGGIVELLDSARQEGLLPPLPKDAVEGGAHPNSNVPRNRPISG